MRVISIPSRALKALLLKQNKQMGAFSVIIEYFYFLMSTTETNLEAAIPFFETFSTQRRI